ncbi:hybrid sensor histidine kinase/response regulator [Sphaerotilus sp.]|uniref:hybrid sensor histidine kinase/response regulator n=1 Tax=Sphaerotilus sp. TaxID=2093942 RepID=UPI002ACE62D0|nr:ATP-binding protein [Sphaerotilus sp.]MDZ7854887.1 ATP-binding protein [Sphaerotilus sp.]
MKFRFQHLSSRFHLALGLSSLVVSVLLMAQFAGLVPDRDSALRAGRVALAETVAVSSMAMLDEEDRGRLQQVLDFVVQRNPALRSIRLQRADGVLHLQAGTPVADPATDPPADHPTQTPASTETRLRLQLVQGGAPWGEAELQFDPLHDHASVRGWLGSTELLVAATALSCFVLFYVYLRRMLRHLDPSRVIPGRVRTAFDTLAEGLMVLDPAGRIVLANRAFSEVVGQDSDALIGRSASGLGWSQPEQAGVAGTPWQQVFTDGQARRNVLMHLTDAQGRARTFMVNASPVPGPGGQPAGTLISLDDVTMLEEQEVQLRLARDAAEAANRAKSDFLANMSHEIRTPMNAILGFAELLRRGWQNNPQDTRRHLDTILGSGRHLLALINDILDLSKVEAGRLEVECVPCAVHAVLHEVIDIMRLRADEKDVFLAIEFAEALPATLLTDPGRLRQILTNLVGNALKFTREGGVTVRVSLQRGAPENRLCIDIADTGIGIPADKLDAIFEPFVQAEASTTRQFGGTGLGLAISRRFARALGGDVTVSSVPGQGSTFHVTLETGPLDALDPDEWLSPQALAAVARPRTGGGTVHWQFDAGRVLVVDDGAENRELVRLVLESAGLTVVEAEDGAVALDMVAREAPDLVLMDVNMPVMDGYTATRTLRERGCTLPVLALTANAMKGFEAQIETAGFSGYLTKPVDIDALLAELGQRLGGRRVAGMAPEAAPRWADSASADPARDDDTPIVSRLADHPRLSRVVQTFCRTLPDKLVAMQGALDDRRLDDLADLAHWLKGAGGTVGFDVFFEPAREFERLARAGDTTELERVMRQIQALARRIEIPHGEAAAAATLA